MRSIIAHNENVSPEFLLLGALLWLAVAVMTAVLVGRSISLGASSRSTDDRF